MELSLAGLVGAAVGLVIGYVDFKMVSGVVRSKWQNRFAASRDGLLNVVQFCLFAATVLGFPVVGYFMGLTIGG